MLEKTPESLLDARRSNQSILKEINSEYSLERLMLKLKFQYFGHLWEELTHLKRPWCWEILKAVLGEGNRGWDGWMASPTWWTRVWANSRRQWRTEKPGVLQSMEAQRVRHDWVTEQRQHEIWTWSGGQVSKIMASQRHPHANPQNCEHRALHEKRGFAWLRLKLR